MLRIPDDRRLPDDVEAQPVVRAAAALRPVIRGFRDELEREQRLPKALVEQCHAAGFYRLVRPRALGGLASDPLTYLRVVELLAEGAGSVGWNLCNNNIAQLVSLGPGRGYCLNAASAAESGEDAVMGVFIMPCAQGEKFPRRRLRR